MVVGNIKNPQGFQKPFTKECAVNHIAVLMISQHDLFFQGRLEAPRSVGTSLSTLGSEFSKVIGPDKNPHTKPEVS